MKDVHIKRSPTNPGAVLNTDQQGLIAYKRQKAKFSEIGELRDENKNLKERLERLEALILPKGAYTT